MLEIPPQQERALADATFARRVFAFLRDEADDVARKYDDAALRELVRRALATGRELRIESERELVRWAYLGVLTGEACFADEATRGVMTRGGDDPEKVGRHLDKLVTARGRAR